MSYILDALRKAERDHQVSRVPTLATTHGGADLRRAVWIWPVAGGLLAVGGLVVAYTLQWAPGHAIRRDSVGEANPPATSAIAASRPDPAGEATPPDPGAVALARPDPAAAPLVEPAPERPPAEHPAAARRPAGPGVAPLVSSPTPFSASPASRKAPAVPTRPRRPAAAAAPVSRSPAPSVARAAASPPIDRDSIQEPRASAEAPPPAAAAVTPSDGGSSRAAVAAPAQGLPRLALDVLVYSEVAAERLVFINGRKYVEGQIVDGGAVIEQITPDGAILRYEGRQIALRPKLNPYARPGSP